MSFPGCRFFLFCRIGPGIAVMKIDHNPHSPLLRPDCHGNRFVFAAMTTSPVIRRIDPSPEPDSIDSVIFQNLEAILLNASIVIELVTSRFHLWKPAYISPFRKISIRNDGWGF